MWNVNCGGRIVIPENGKGIIISPNFPNYYDSGLSCTYEMIANSRIITGEFTHFDLEPGELKCFSFKFSMILHVMENYTPLKSSRIS